MNCERTTTLLDSLIEWTTIKLIWYLYLFPCTPISWLQLGSIGSFQRGQRLMLDVTRFVPEPSASGIKVPWNPCLYESFSQHNSQRPLNYVQLLQLLQLAHATLYPPFSQRRIIILPCRNPPSLTSELVSHHPPTPPSNHRVFNSTRRACHLCLIAKKTTLSKKKNIPDKYSLQAKGSLQIVPRVNGFDE